MLRPLTTPHPSPCYPPCQATFEHEMVASVDLSKRPFVIKTNTSALTAHALIVSTGADSRWLGAPGEDMYRGGGVSSCATCDGFLWREKHCAVIGGTPQPQPLPQP